MITSFITLSVTNLEGCPSNHPDVITRKENTPMNRREFIEATALTTLLYGVGIQGANAADSISTGRKPMSLKIQDGAVVLFQGDSITDAGRNRENPSSLGGGYAMMTAAWLSALYPERKVTFLNRGISGNRAVDLQARWQADCLALQPTWISILVGVNDAWRGYDSGDVTTANTFEERYRDLIGQVQKQLKANLVLCEPFLLHITEEIKKMREDLDPKIEVVRKLAKEYGATLVPLDVLFQEACQHREPAFWAADGVHPSEAGNALIAQAWLQAVGG
jgi:lysophospholipase L1-like esterase